MKGYITSTHHKENETGLPDVRNNGASVFAAQQALRMEW